MKKYMLSFITALFLSGLLIAQDYNTRIPLIGEMTPEFSSNSTEGKINFPDDFPNKWKIIFSHPADFTPVCSSEILYLADIQEEFEDRDAKIFVLSTDGLSSHMAWIKSLESIPYPDGKTNKINFPLIPDSELEISKKFGMIHSYTSKTRDVRGVFIIDPTNRIQAIMFYPMNIGRDMDEILRVLVALQTADKHYVLTPANWQPGEEVLINSPSNQKEAEKMQKLKGDKVKSLSWYMWFKELSL
jgi:peroxiredoxin (alkyl hydroperoxide reductase subunit C)